MSAPDKREKLTPEKFRELWDLAGEMIAGETAHRIWMKLYAQRRAIREVAKGL